MSNWYKVTKRINGRLYDYWQRTKRVGKSVKTENKYIGPAGISAPFSPTVSTARYSTPEEAVNEFRTPFPHLRRQERLEDEAIQYGPLKARIKRQKAALHAARKATKGIKRINPFIAKLGLTRNDK